MPDDELDMAQVHRLRDAILGAIEGVTPRGPDEMLLAVHSIMAAMVLEMSPPMQRQVAEILRDIWDRFLAEEGRPQFNQTH